MFLYQAEYGLPQFRLNTSGKSEKLDVKVTRKTFINKYKEKFEILQAIGII